MFIFTCLCLGVGLAMDAFSVSLANGLNEPNMRARKACGIAAIFAFFQALMPLIGWICIHTIVEKFQKFELFIPWIALLLLGFIGGKMIYEGIKNKGGEVEPAKVGFAGLLVQGVATSIDALSAGFSIANYGLAEALLAALIIALVTFILCLVGVIIGRSVGTKIASVAGIFGGAILVLIGLIIFFE